MDVTLTELGKSAAFIKNSFAQINIVAFAGLRANGGYGIPVYEFVKTLSSLDANVLFVRDLSTRWYNFDLQEFSADIDDTVRIIESFLNLKFGDLPIVCIGNSMGGYAALMFAEKLRARLAIAVCPQTFISKSMRSATGDDRWADRLDHISPTVPDLKPLMKGGCARSIVVVGDRNPGDLLHAGNVVGCPNVSIQIEKGANHDVNKRWKDTGLLAETYRELIYQNL